MSWPTGPFHLGFGRSCPATGGGPAPPGAADRPHAGTWLSAAGGGVLTTLTEEVTRSSEIEGEKLDKDVVRSSLARRLGINAAGVPSADRHVEGAVEMMLDATQNFEAELTADRLFGWHASLFPTGRSGMKKIAVGKWRDASAEPMQVVSGDYRRKKDSPRSAGG